MVKRYECRATVNYYKVIMAQSREDADEKFEDEIYSKNDEAIVSIENIEIEREE